MYKKLSPNLLQVLQNALLKTKDISDISTHLYNSNVGNFLKTSTNRLAYRPKADSVQIFLSNDDDEHLLSNKRP
jgi:hypothetical protein